MNPRVRFSFFYILRVSIGIFFYIFYLTSLAGVKCRKAAVKVSMYFIDKLECTLQVSIILTLFYRWFCI